MLALKLLLNVAGVLFLAAAVAIPLAPTINRVLHMRKSRAEGNSIEPLFETGEISWRGPVAVALVACVPLLIAASIVVVPSGKGAVRISQISGTEPGTLYPG